MDLRHLLAAAALALAAGAAAQERPSEADLFGAPPPAPQQATPPAERPPDGATPARPTEGELFGGQGSPNATQPPPQGIISKEKEDSLRVGGQLYLRAVTGGLQDQDLRDWRLSSPNLLDTYLDVRPNDRVRGFALGRLFYDPTILPADSGARSIALSSLLQPQQLAGGSGGNPHAVLDQLWVNFDVERRAFVTVGRQHAKWGVGKFWNPTDYLHPVKRNPLAVFDERTGTTMVKVHVPWEARGWNLYAVSVLEDVAGDPPRRADGTQDGTNRLGRLSAGGRAEVVLGGVELGADALVQSGHRPRFGVDVSTGLWDLDVYGEAALRTTVDTPRWRAVPGATDLLQAYERHDPVGFTPQVVVGATYDVKYSDEDAVSLGAEYFYDHSGYDGPRIYPALLAVSSLSALPSTASFDPTGATTFANGFTGQPSPFTPFHLGKHYGGLYVSLPNPGSWNHTTFTLSVLGNLSDKSFIARLDHSVLVLTYLRVETFVAGHFGAREGEFRAGYTIPAGTIAGQPFQGFSTPPAILDAGVALRVSL